MHGTFQQFMAFPVDSVVKVSTLHAYRVSAVADCQEQMSSNLSFEEAATIPSGLATAVFPVYNQAEGAPSAKLIAPWEEGGLGKYANKPIFILGGSSSIGQFSEC